ncbi:MAG: gas vesicle protein GvpN [Bacteroidetes bacterium]|nr:gas vesicle protein GvpN [Bacteroidota bacterium]
MIRDTTTLIEPTPQEGFVETRFIQDITNRAMSYMGAGFPVHFRGRAGTGKTTLAMHIASKIGRPVVLIHGDEEFTTADLVGGEYGYRIRKVVDNFIHSVLKTEEDMVKRWVDNRLTVAAKYGFTLIYDEFTRSRPEANNILLSILEEHILDLPAARGGEHYLQVDPDFRAIFTSNPEEYAGTHETQDALRDRMITLDMENFDEDTEIAITISKSNISKSDAEKIVALIRDLRSSDVCEVAPTVRASVMICRAAHLQNIRPAASNPIFRQICMDILTSQTMRYGPNRGDGRIKNVVQGLIDKHCPALVSQRKVKTEKKKVMVNA